MGLLDEPGLERLIAAGCERCGSHRLSFGSFVDGVLPVMGGEPVGAITWMYDGEKFVDGVFEVSCAGCGHGLFVADVCPRCHAQAGLARALESTNRWTVPLACPGCEGEELKYVALLPAKVVYEGRRAEKARSYTELYDAGFHGYRADCRDCGTIAKKLECPLCDAAAPLRPRP